MKRLFITFEALGDAVMRCGALRVLATGATLDLAGQRHLAVYGDCPWIGSIIDARPLLRRRHPWLDPLVPGRAELAARLQAAGYDEVICYRRDADHGLRRWLQTRLPSVRRIEIPREHSRRPGHATEISAGLLESIGFSCADFDAVPDLALAPARLAAAAQRLAAIAGPRAVCIQPNTALTTTPWWDVRRKRMGVPKALPVATWAALCERLLRADAASGIVCLGTDNERGLAVQIREAVAADLRGRIHLDAIGTVGTDMAAMTRAAALLVSIDTGPAHLAAAVGARVLIAFGPSDEQRFTPRGPGEVRTIVHDVPCRPCYGTPVARRCRDNICMRLMPVERLAAAALDMLSRRAPTTAVAAPPG